MEKLINQTVFKCSYCSRISKSAAGMRLHEIYCKKNPLSHILCASCRFCEKVEEMGKEGSRCKTCCYYVSDPSDNGYPRCMYTNCYYGDDRQVITDFVCKHDGKKMYSPKILRYNEKKRKAIMARCQKPMADEVSGCPIKEALDKVKFKENENDYE